MKRTVSVLAATSGAAADVRLDAARTLGDVLPRLLELTGSPASTITLAGQALDPRLPVAHLRDGDLLVLTDRALTPRSTAARLEVTSGPDAGVVVDLPPGRWLVGRDAEGLALSDDQISRHHLELEVGADGSVMVTDLGSTNGTSLYDVPLAPRRPVPWPAGEVLRCGVTSVVHGRMRADAATVVCGDGTTVVNRPPRLEPEKAPAVVTFPATPTPATTGRLPLLASLAPLLAGVVLAMVMHRWEFLAFAVMSPLVVLGQALTDRWGARRSNRAAARDHAAATARAEEQLIDALNEERRWRHERAPDLAALTRAATERSTLLWHRGRDDVDALSLRLGLGDLPAHVQLHGDIRTPTLNEVPVCINLVDAHVVGVCGPGADGAARSLVMQATTLLGPADLAITVLAPQGAARWAWARWLPHAALATTPAQVRQQIDRLTAADPSRLRLIVLEGSDADLAATLASQPDTSVVCVSSTAERLPAACRAVITVGPDSGLVRREGASETVFMPDLLSDAAADRVARSLCSLRDGRTASSELPRVVAWSQLHDVALGTASAGHALSRRWRSGPSTTVCLGVSADGPHFVDLQADGPHLLVAGTTGAGKSELLQSLVASLVASNAPADLNLLLVDFKGGAAFGPCAALPHTVGVLTDLDAATTTRAIESLTAELRRRERVLAETGAPDLDAWRAQQLRQGGRCDQLPRLVIVVDEFATLAEELPDFVGGLVGIAQRGRSLGIHLVLATQRPEGSVSADIRANTRLRICLAVAREAESRDVLDSPRAVTISRETPGRALVRAGAQQLVEVQTARVAGPAAPRHSDHLTDGVEVLPLMKWGEAPVTGEATSAATELDLLVAAASDAAALSGAGAAAAPWLPPLPPRITLTELPAVDFGVVAVGVVDQPHLQAQPTLTIGTEDAEPWLVVGGARSGRSSAALSVATALAAAMGPDALHIYAVGHGRAVEALSCLPHTGAVVDVREADRVDRLLTFLASELDGPANIDRSTALPRRLLVVDGWDSLLTATADVDAGRCPDLVLRLLAQGPAAGIRVLLTSDRSGLTGRLSAAVRNRFCLRLADSADYALLGIAPRRVPSAMPPGRAIRADDAAQVQFALPDDETTRRAQAWPLPAVPARRFEVLPTRVPLHTLGPCADRLIVGVGGDDGGALLLDPQDVGGAFIVAGPPRSGRSTALVSIAAQLHARSPVALCNRPGPLRQRRDLAVVADAGDPARVREALSSLPSDGALLVDDVDLLDDASLLDDIESTMRRLRDGGGLVVLAGTTDAMAASFRGPVAQARRGRAGLLLRPEGAHDGDLLGVRLRRRPGHIDPPGRGVLAMHGRAVPVQVPDPS